MGFSRIAWFAGPRVTRPRPPMTPGQLAHYPLMIGPPGSRLHGTVMRWLGDAGVAPTRISNCNNVAVTQLAIRDGVAVGAVPARVMAGPDVCYGKTCASVDGEFRGRP